MPIDLSLIFLLFFGSRDLGFKSLVFECRDPGTELGFRVKRFRGTDS